MIEEDIIMLDIEGILFALKNWSAVLFPVAIPPVKAKT